MRGQPSARQLSCPGSVMTPWRETLAQKCQRSRSRQVSGVAGDSLALSQAEIG